MRAPKTPSAGETPAAVSPALGFNNLVANLSSEWGLELVVPSFNSPTKDELQQLSASCISRLKHLFYKKAYEGPLDDFRRAAKEQQNSWIHKPAADRDTLPSTRSTNRLSQEQRKRRLQLLLDILEPVHQRLVKEQSQRSRNGGFNSPLQDMPQFRDDSAIPISLMLKSKRTSSEFTDPESLTKRFKVDEKIFGRIDDVPVNTRKTPKGKGSGLMVNSLLPNWPVKHPLSPGRESISTSSTDSSNSSVFSTTLKDGLTTMDTSFASETKVSRLSQSLSQFDDIPPEDFPSTALLLASAPSVSSTPLMPSTPSSATAKIKERLQGVFPILPNCLNQAPLAIRYEIVRIFLHTDTSLSTLDQSPIPIPKASEVKEYEEMWNWLKRLPALVDKKFPPKSDTLAWDMALSTFHKRFKRVHMSGSLRASNSSEGPLFAFQLHELQTELGHRLGRRFGHDRFIDIKMPLLEDPSKLPKRFAQLMVAAGTGRDQIIEWLHRGNHDFLGRCWVPFYVKDKARKKGKQAVLDEDDAKAFEPRRVCFFATSGVDVAQDRKFPEKGEPIENHTKLTVEQMLNWLLSIKIKENKEQSFLKFYSRISLGLSTTYATVVLECSQIKKRKNDIRSKETNEVMNDGCGLMSMQLAKNISDMLGLLTIPSAFQGRIGAAKGLWIVDYFSKAGTSDKVWIETYPSQRKWERDDNFAEQDHTTFEVLKWSSPLKSAALNLQFLPLLEDRGVSREAISKLLTNGLSYEIGQMRAAVDSPLSFRKWIGEQYPRVSERLKTGVVKFNGARPDSSEETLTMTLDAGFDPKRFGYSRELARKLFKNRCDALREKLNIPVGLSTYAYIAVDFQGILAPDEVQLCFSTPFRDEISGKTMLEVEGMDVLIARSPAHLVSDIQRVHAVFKPELMKYKDVVILPSTGNFPLAGLLSGGDYDGDTVWLCFDQEIVQSFQNAETPKQPDLLKFPRGNPLLRRNTMKFKKFLPGGDYTFTDFLQKGFEFNFRNSFLGICTFQKEQICYDENNVSSETAVYFSTLLSYLVDQAKQGYLFDNDDLQRFRSFISKKDGHKKKSLPTAGTRNGHIKDYLTKNAQEITEKALTEQYESLGEGHYFDPDLIKCAKDFGELAQSSEAHKATLKQLKEDIAHFKNLWSSAFSKRDRVIDETKLESKVFKETVIACFDKWQDIQPIGEQWLKKSLLQTWVHRDHSHWSLLKASVAYQLFERGFIWWMACRELCALKGMANYSCNVVIPSMYASFKSDANFIRMKQNGDLDPEFQEAKAEVKQVMEDEDDDEDNSDDIWFSMDEDDEIL